MSKLNKVKFVIVLIVLAICIVIAIGLVYTNFTAKGIFWYTTARMNNSIETMLQEEDTIKVIENLYENATPNVKHGFVLTMLLNKSYFPDVHLYLVQKLNEVIAIDPDGVWADDAQFLLSNFILNMDPKYSLERRKNLEKLIQDYPGFTLENYTIDNWLFFVKKDVSPCIGPYGELGLFYLMNENSVEKFSQLKNIVKRYCSSAEDVLLKIENAHSLKQQDNK